MEIGNFKGNLIKICEAPIQTILIYQCFNGNKKPKKETLDYFRRSTVALSTPAVSASLLLAIGLASSYT